MPRLFAQLLVPSATLLLIAVLLATCTHAAETNTKPSADNSDSQAKVSDQTDDDTTNRNSANENDADTGDATDENETDTSGVDAAETLAGHSYHGHVFNEGPRQSAYLMGDTGNVHFPVTTEIEKVQEFVDQGIGQLHGFWFFESERTFRQAAALDPNCAIAYWGMAMSNFENKDRARDFIAEAVKRKQHADPREVMYIEALSDYLAEDEKKDKEEDEEPETQTKEEKEEEKKKNKKERAQKYVEALEEIVFEHPDDIEAKALLVLQLWKNRSNQIPITSHLAIDALIQQVLDVEPLHPVHHFRIHLWDYKKPERAIAAAATCGQSAPAIAHMWHMPGHIFSRLKRYGDAVWQQEASARIDHAHMMRDKLLPDQIHNFAHNNEWLIRNLIFIGRIQGAVDLAKNMTELPQHPKYNTLDERGSAFYGRQRLFQALTAAEMWEELIALSDTPYLEESNNFNEQVKRLRLVGRAHYRLGNFATGSQIKTELQELLTEKETALATAETELENEKAAKETESESDQESDGDSEDEDQNGDNKDEENEGEREEKSWKDQVRDLKKETGRLKKAIDELHAYEQLEDGLADAAFKKFKKAGEMGKLFLAEIEIETGEVDKALKKLADYVESNEGETIPLAKQTHLLWKCGKGKEAAAAFSKLQEISTFVDLNAPVFSKLRPIATELGLGADWRIIKPTADDVGVRPELDSLGPFRWQPTPAPNWSLYSPQDKKVSLADYRGKPVVLIFFLGHGCLHCVEQLHEFGPQTDTFAKAGIELVAISSEDRKSLKSSVDDYTDLIPFPLLSNSDQEVFKQYRAFDDFEDQPLHATCLIDADGYLRWQDISYEPFMDHEFVLSEAKRLLAQPPVDADKNIERVSSRPSR